MDDEEIFEALAFISGVFPPLPVFNRLVNEGADGSEVHHIDGDDLAGACHYLNQLMEHFNVPQGVIEQAAEMNRRVEDKEA